MSEEWNRPEVSEDLGPSANQINRELGNSINLGSDTKLVRLRIQTPITNFGQEKVDYELWLEENYEFSKIPNLRWFQILGLVLFMGIHEI